MREFYDLDEGTKHGEKRCAICGKIDKKENLSFKRTVNGPVITIDGKVYPILCWVCSKCAEQVREPVYALPESGAVYTFPPQKGDTYQTP